MPQQQKKKSPYKPPAIVSSETYERLALGCNGTQGGRTPQPKNGAASCTTLGAS